MGWRRAVAVGTFPLVLGGSLAVTRAGQLWGIEDQFWLVTAVCLGAAAVLLVVQRVLPLRPEWQKWNLDAAVDALHSVLSSGGASAVARALVFGVAYTAAAWIGQWMGTTPWPDQWPMVLQLALALVIGDFGIYWLHRLSHTWEPLWRLHALHHSSERLYLLSSGRNHPIHTAMTYLLEVVPLILLGANGDVLALHGVFAAVHGLLQHANIDLALGPLNWVFSTADLHRWHHSAKEHESKSNYGNNVIFWDVVFRTRVLPTDRRTPDAVGIEGMHFSRNYFDHLASPVLLEEWVERRAEGAEA